MRSFYAQLINARTDLAVSVIITGPGGHCTVAFHRRVGVNDPTGLRCSIFGRCVCESTSSPRPEGDIMEFLEREFETYFKEKP
jgi:hypothetical protein